MNMGPVNMGVMGAYAISAAGPGWRGLAKALVHDPLVHDPLIQDRDPAHEFHARLDDLALPGTRKQQRLMSRAARLAAMCVREAMRDAGLAGMSPEAREQIGYFLGVGASDGSIDEMGAMLASSMDGEHLSMARLGSAGIAACHPLRAFHLLSNFTMCHGAILEGVQGPNGAFFSRGSGTVIALMEAMYAVADGDCDHALAGGADTALHPVTWAEIERAGLAQKGMQPGEGAAILALGRTDAPLAVITRCEVYSSGRAVFMHADDHPSLHSCLPPSSQTAWSCPDAVRAHAAEDIDHVIIAAWGEPPRTALGAIAAEVHAQATVLYLVLGETLAASPALAWTAALDLIHSKNAARVRVLSAGLDGDVGDVIMTAGDAS